MQPIFFATRAMSQDADKCAKLLRPDCLSHIPHIGNKGIPDPGPKGQDIRIHQGASAFLSEIGDNAGCCHNNKQRDFLKNQM